MVSGIIEWKDDSEIDIKTKNILAFILKNLHQIKPQFFNDQQLDQQEEVEDLQKQEVTKTEKAKKTLDKDKMKKR